MLKPANYDDMVSDIQDGKAVQSHGYTATTQGELDTVIAYPAYQEALKAEGEPEAKDEQKAEPDEFDAMSYADLKAAATEAGIDYGANVKKVELQAALREAKAAEAERGYQNPDGN